jgi:uncharacterized membrane protein YdjX (TVP38/TMEM64 family)
MTSNVRRIALACAILALVLLVAFVPPDSGYAGFAEWSANHPLAAALAFSVLVVLAMVIMLPVSIQAMAAGFLFGLGEGFVIMYLAGLVGFTAAFLVGRFLARPWVAHLASRRPEFARIDLAMHERGLAVVVLARLSQVLPYNLLNYFLGLTAVKLKDYVTGSAIGMVPGILLFVFVGTTATDITAILRGEVDDVGSNLWIAGIGLLLLAAALLLITRTARRALKLRLSGAEKRGAGNSQPLDS